MDPISDPPPPASAAAAVLPDDRPTSSLALWALILGIAAIATSCVGIGAALGLAALILGVLAIGKTGDPPYGLKGKGMAITGLVLGIVSFALLPVFALMIGIMLPALGAARRTARQVQNSTQLRGIQQSMVTYAQSNKQGGMDGYYPGLDAQGNDVDLSVEFRMKTLLDGNYFTPEYLVNPADTQADVYDPYDVSSSFSADNYSYALLDISEPGGRRDEWSETLNTLAVVLSDRNTGADADQRVSSVWTETDSGDWRGGITRNDNSTMFETSHVLQNSGYGGGATQYGSGAVNATDNLFEAAGGDDALLIHSGD